ncbi:MAG: putative acetyltransferase [Methanosaeta sp. PtaU1.Bin112]|nr:MAG: putative acetyltransferase [Methanosaeta sp. PtaU1.Bin112]
MDKKQIIFRKAAIEDAPNLIKLCKETIVQVYGQILPWEKLEPWVEGDMVAEQVNKQWQDMIVAEKAGDIVGVAARSDDKVDILWIHPAHHRRGIGSSLLDIVETELRKSGHDIAKLECFSDNHRAMEFYRAKGFKPICEEMDEEAGALKMVMTKTLADESGQFANLEKTCCNGAI